MNAVTDILRSMDYGVSPEANDHVLAWLDKHGRRFDHFVGGEFVAPGEGAYFGVVDPARGSSLAQCAQGSAADVDGAVLAARKAQENWARLSGDARARYLYAIARLLQKRERFFAVLETMDKGKLIRESRDIDVPLAVRRFYHHAGWAELARKRVSRTRAGGAGAGARVPAPGHPGQEHLGALRRMAGKRAFRGAGAHQT